MSEYFLKFSCSKHLFTFNVRFYSLFNLTVRMCWRLKESKLSLTEVTRFTLWQFSTLISDVVMNSAGLILSTKNIWLNCYVIICSRFDNLQESSLKLISEPDSVYVIDWAKKVGSRYENLWFSITTKSLLCRQRKICFPLLHSKFIDGEITKRSIVC